MNAEIYIEAIFHKFSANYTFPAFPDNDKATSNYGKTAAEGKFC